MISIWPKVPLKSIYKGLYDGPHATPAESDEGAIFLGIKNVTESGRLDLSEIRHIAEADLGKWTKRVIPQKDDIVFSYEATLHRYARIPEGFRGCLGRRMALIRVNPEIANIDFVFSYFLGPIWRCEIEKNILSGATVDRIPLTNVPDFNVYLPPLAIQKKIAAILSAYDDLIENNLKRIKLLEEMAQITYEEWFVRLKFPDHETTPIDSATGLPVGWEKSTLGKCCTLVMGQSPKSEFYNYEKEGLPFHQGVKDYGYRFPENTCWSTDGSRIAKAKDILFSVRAPVGRLNIAIEDIILGRGLSAIRHKNGSQSFLFYQLKKKFFQEDMLGGGAIFASVTKEDMLRIELLKPDNRTETEFNQYAASIDLSIENLYRQNQLLKEARDILLPRLMTGMINVEQLVLPEPFSNPSASMQEPQAV